MTDAKAEVRFRDDSWEQDWFLAKSAAEVPGLGITARYLPPAEFHAFPTFEVESWVGSGEDRNMSKARGLPGLWLELPELGHWPP